MKNNPVKFLPLALICFIGNYTISAVDVPKNLKSPEGTQGPSSVVLLWDKPDNYSDISSYEIFMNGKHAGSSVNTNFTVKGLATGKTYSFSIKARSSTGEVSRGCKPVKVTTRKETRIFNVVDYGARGDSTTMNTKAIQNAIDACTPGGTVLIPAGVFLSGALFLKSHMTFYIQKGGVLKGSAEIEDYYPLIPTRFEGWTIPESFSSLITAGKLDPSGKIYVKNLAIRGEGRISGGDSKLGKAMTAAKGIRSRGRLMCLMNCENVDIQGLSIEKTPCWCIHYTFSKNVSVHDVYIHSTASNGDGIDPDSSTDSYIFNCTFSTGDDCIAIKSGKNPEGNVVNKPTSNVWITGCNFVRGHSLAIGSEMSGGVENVIVRDCLLGNLYYGLQIKGTKDRGGYVENVSVKDCDLQQIKIVTSVNYNNDGASAGMPVFRKMEFSNLNMTRAGNKVPVIFIEGFDDPHNYTNDIVLSNIKLPVNSKVYIKDCRDIKFENVVESEGNKKPAFEIISSENIIY